MTPEYFDTSVTVSACLATFCTTREIRWRPF